MASETPVSLKKKKRIRHPSDSRICVIHYNGLENYGDIRSFSEYAWNKTQETKTKILNSDEPCNRLVEICDQIPERLNSEKHGFHRPCYKSFTNMKYLQSKRKIQDEDEETSVSSLKRRCNPSSSSTIGSLFSSDLCIICNKQTRYFNRKLEKLVKCVTEASKTSIHEAALLRSDNRIISITSNFCLIAKEAHYHSICRKEYTRKEDRQVPVVKPQDEASEMQSKDRENAHAQTFQHLKDYVKTSILDGFNVERMTMLRERYSLYMQEHYPVFYNQHYKTYKLKEKLIKAFGQKIKFWQPNFRSELVYAADSAGGNAIETAFESAASEERRLEEAGLILRRQILDAYSKKLDMKWPPSADELLNPGNQLPQLLNTFLTSLLRTKGISQSERAERLTNSLSQDICYAVTNGKWKLPKQLFLGMTVRHITGSAQLITILNRFGHCVSNSALLELETAMCDSATELESPLPASICRDNYDVLNFCWDNFDLNEETITGSGTTHSTHGIVIQQVQQEHLTRPEDVANDKTPTNSVRPNSEKKKRSASYKPVELQPCFVKQRAEPPMVQLVNIENLETQSETDAMMSDFLWFFVRKNFPYEFPAWKGWVCLTSEHTKEIKSVVEYMAPLNASINDNATVQKVLQLSQQASREAGQSSTLVTFDLAVANKAYDIIWQHPDFYRDVFVHLGVFHTVLSYLSAIGKLMKGSGFEDIVSEAGLCASGSMDRVLTGKHYNRAMHVHSVLVEALERLLFISFTQQTDATKLNADAREAIKLMTSDSSKCNTILKSDAFIQLASQYFIFKEDVRNGKHGKTAQFWLQYMDRVWLIFRFSRATKSNDLDLHISCFVGLRLLIISRLYNEEAWSLSTL